ncbi:MAG: hypothetical protein B6241_14880 [Spirochaetaceae bacterium 4572_59]|nr:MAG: hypothetical protein B6241_14880 [Spirochaetaceae bacterium 4572_59]
MPVYSIAFACGIMFATGGSAIIATKLGKGDKTEAGGDFTSLLLIGGLFGVTASLVCFIFMKEIILLSFPFLIIKILFESLLRVDGKPGKALYMTLLGGIVNIILDYLFMVPLNMGIAGAGLGTFLGIVLSLSIGFHHFNSSSSMMRFKIIKPDLKFLTDTVINGSSEMVNEAAIALSTVIFNTLAIKYMGDQGVAAIAVIMSINFLSVSLIIGYSFGVAPLISYNYGRKNNENLQKLLQYSLLFISVVSVLFFSLNMLAPQWFVSIYLNDSTETYKIAIEGLRIFSFSYLFSGITLFGSAFFTAFENGKISALISFTKSFVVFMIIAFILPGMYGITGIWMITPLTEFAAMILVFYYMKKYQKKYNYSLKMTVQL